MTGERFQVIEIRSRTLFRFQVIDYGPEYSVRVDTFRTRHSAESAARSLNAGVARVDHHAIVGCKVVAA